MTVKNRARQLFFLGLSKAELAKWFYSKGQLCAITCSFQEKYREKNSDCSCLPHWTWEQCLHPCHPRCWVVALELPRCAGNKTRPSLVIYFASSILWALTTKNTYLHTSEWQKEKLTFKYILYINIKTYNNMDGLKLVQSYREQFSNDIQ